MDCETCGRYRPSAEVAPIREAGGRLVMACARCRRLSTGRRRAPQMGTAGRSTLPVRTGVLASAR